MLAKNWSEPERWNKRHVESGGAHHGQPSPKVFPSLCDWLDEEVSPAWLANFMALVHLTPNLNWLLLTKRPENWRERIDAAAMAATPFHQEWLVNWLKGTPPSNVWFGVSVEDQTRANERIPILLQIPSALRWLSIEPLLGPLDLSEWLDIDTSITPDANGNPVKKSIGKQLHWLVVGGESGPKARPCVLGWIVELVDQACDSSTPIFVKQVGHNYHEFGLPRQLKHAKGGDPEEWPWGIRFRQFPTQPTPR